jgi:Competence-damaged protein
MPTLAAMAQAVGALLKERDETVAVSESSTGGLISTSLLAVRCLAAPRAVKPQAHLAAGASALQPESSSR